MKHQQDNHAVDIACDKCDYCTKNMEDLALHKSTTHKQSANNCAQCSYIAIHGKDLNRHVLMMHDDAAMSQENKCDLCNYMAIHLMDLNRHKRAMHEE